LAYFTDPMGDEFKKAIEEAMNEIEDNKENDDSKRKVRKKPAKRKPAMRRLSSETKKSLK